MEKRVYKFIAGIGIFFVVMIILLLFVGFFSYFIHDSSQAIRHYNKGVEAFFKDSDIILAREYMQKALQEERGEEAKQKAQKFMDVMFPEFDNISPDAVDYYIQAMDYLVKDKNEEALEFTEKAIEESPLYIRPYLLKSQILLNNKEDFEQALILCNEAKKISKNYPNVYLAYHRIYFEHARKVLKDKKDPAKALELFQKSRKALNEYKKRELVEKYRTIMEENFTIVDDYIDLATKRVKEKE